MADDSDVETGSQSSMSDYKMLSPMDTFKETAKKLKRTMAVNSIEESASLEILDEKENQTRYAIYVNVLVNYIGKIDLVEQTFILFVVSLLDKNLIPHYSTAFVLLPLT